VIHLDDVHLHYSLKAFRETSLKSYMFKLAKGKVDKTQDVHALKGISFSAKTGERIGIIGHNGAGKTTLLRTIAGLYPISKGSCHVRGDIRSLFEITLGFETEATGRENILYRGLLLGQTPKTMKALEKEIIEFAELGSFIDYPVKTYSAGMLVRLAFAISTIIAGDILLIDEVIGAGDAAFMKKASDRIQGLISQAKIMLLVSHDLSAIRSFCNRLLLMDKGTLVFDGNIEEGIDKYHALASKRSSS
jgi:lipopolysaccharide transport system ATP-binding protein